MFFERLLSTTSWFEGDQQVVPRTEPDAVTEPDEQGDTLQHPRGDSSDRNVEEPHADNPVDGPQVFDPVMSAAEPFIFPGARDRSVRVRPEIPVQFFHDGPVAHRWANFIATQADWTGVRVLAPVHRLDGKSIRRMNAKLNIIFLANENDDDEGLQAFLQSFETFHTKRFQDNSYFAIVRKKANGILLSAEAIRLKMDGMRADEFVQECVVSQTDGRVQERHLIDWTERGFLVNGDERGSLRSEILQEMRMLETEQHSFISRIGSPDQVYFCPDQDYAASIELAGKRGHFFKGEILHRKDDCFVRSPSDVAQHVAIKRLHLYTAMWYLRRGVPENPLLEIVRLNQLEGYGIVPGFIDAICDGDYLYIITVYASEGSLSHFTSKCPDGRLPENLARDFSLQMFQILDVLHGQLKICHHDLKPDNILINKTVVNGCDTFKVWLTDFAQSIEIPQDGMIRDYRPHATVPYRLPEHHRGEPYYARHYDVWSWMLSLVCATTGRSYLYARPDIDCFLYEYAILEKGLSRFSPSAAALRYKL